MKKIIVTGIIIICICILFVGCANRDKAALAEWLQSIGNENVEVYFWRDLGIDERLLSKDEVQTFCTILAGITSDKLTWNRELAGITPEYGLRLVIDEEVWWINQEDGPYGQSDFYFRKKQWCIDSLELSDFMNSLLEDQQ